MTLTNSKKLLGGFFILLIILGSIYLISQYNKKNDDDDDDDDDDHQHKKCPKKCHNKNQHCDKNTKYKCKTRIKLMKGFELLLSDGDLIGKRRAAQRVVAEMLRIHAEQNIALILAEAIAKLNK